MERDDGTVCSPVAAAGHGASSLQLFCRTANAQAYTPSPPTSLPVCSLHRLQGWPRLRALVLVGDHKQLPAPVISQRPKDCGYGRSLFERCQAMGMQLLLLDTQYRMNPLISRWPRHTFYNGGVSAAEARRVLQPQPAGCFEGG